jgi:hypothetical protein
MNDLDLASMANSLNTIADTIGALYHIEDEISRLAEDVRDLNTSIDYLTDKIGELKHE